MTNSTLALDCVLIDAENISTDIPNLDQLMTTWASAALVDGIIDVDYWVNFQFMPKEDIQQLNKQFRNKDKPTNVLTFPNTQPFDPEEPFLGDIAICTDILKDEALTENKTLQDHLAHLVMHSILHCQGFDHQTDEEAADMEKLETQLLQEVGIANPY